jgi:hypothetical protein
MFLLVLHARFSFLASTTAARANQDSAKSSAPGAFAAYLLNEVIISAANRIASLASANS